MGQRTGATVTPLAIAVLALLEERPMHPYEMYQLLA
ncbi:PadR family transcriptional regulator, partial [Nocardia cyriacigeorgica]|nr:PadR family transcriptional regulator [Nocardia cyriacigeorgica]